MATALVHSQPKQELRAVWLTNVDSDVLLSDTGIAGAMDYLASINVNVVFPVVWNKGYTLYPSAVMQKTFGATIWPQVAGRDPLERLVVEGHRNGMEVIPWFEFGFSPQFALNDTDLGNILHHKPHWTLRSSSGAVTTKGGTFPQFVWMSGINPQVQDFMTTLIMEAVDRYDIDGVQGDDRLPAMPSEGGYDSATTTLYRREHEGSAPPENYMDAAWLRWRADKLNDYYRRLRDSLKSRSAHLVFSAAPSVYPWGYDNYLQDSKTWIEQEIADHIIPQVYRYDFSAYRTTLAASLSAVPVAKRHKLYSGVLAKAGSYVIDSKFLIQSIRENRTQGVAGESFFFYEALKANHGRLGDTLRKTVYSEPAMIPWRNGSIWRPRGIIVNEDDPGAARSGIWSTLRINGHRPGVLSANDGPPASIRYTINVPLTAWYDIFAYILPNALNSTQASYTLHGVADSIHVLFNQSLAANTGWRQIGTIRLEQGARTVVSLSNTHIGLGKRILADAVMLLVNRKLSPDVMTDSRKGLK